VLDTPAGALAAADNYVAAGITASLARSELREFADALVAPAARPSLLATTARLPSPPPGTNAIGTVVAHSLVSYARARARVSAWEVGSYWGESVAPTQYWAMADLTLRFFGGRWQVTVLEERLPGPVPARIAGTSAAATAGTWSQALTGMSAPYYGMG
jgi:hypothetical protein